MRCSTLVITAIAMIIPTCATAQERAAAAEQTALASAVPSSPELSPPSVAVDQRPSKLFTVLAASYMGLSALDVVTTEHAIQTGRGQEANPLMAGLVRSPYAFALTKMAVATSTVLLMRRMSRKHRVAAIGFLIAADVGLGLVVTHNARIGAAP